MKYVTESKVEDYFIKNDIYFAENKGLHNIPVITVDNYVVLGQLTALRFLEWVCLNPGGLVALPTGKTPEFFIKWVQYYLENWKHETTKGILAKMGYDASLKPDMKSLHFFQLDEFFPINPLHERSFMYFVNRFYIDGFGFDREKVHLINTFDLSDKQKLLLGNGIQNLDQVFPDGKIDLSLRIQKPSLETDKIKQRTIKLFDQFCSDYENKIRNLGGLGLFLGGIGPDGHIAFNVRGSSHHSHTRLTNINYETEAVAATDLGGIELVRKKAVITMGLETITYNPDVVALIIAAGQSKAPIVANAVEKEPDLEYPASALQKLKNARFFITRSAGLKLKLTDKSLVELNKKKELPAYYADKLLLDGLKELPNSIMEVAQNTGKIIKHPKWAIAEQISGKTIDQLADNLYTSIEQKIQRGIAMPKNHKFLHTAPHHDDIELAYFPLLHHLVRSEFNENHFVYCTSGFTAVTNQYVIHCLEALYNSIENKQLENSHVYLRLHDFEYAQEDITGYLNGIASQNDDLQKFYVSTRLARLIFTQLKTKDIVKLLEFVSGTLNTIKAIEPGRKEPEIVHLIKGWLREFEAELVWAHFGIDMDHVSHLRLPFYSDDIFPRYPDFDADVLPILNLMEKIRPSIITLALDPEGSGPDTHYKTLMALADAIDKYVENHPEMNIRIWGYRNIWSKYEIYEANTIVPVSLNSFAVLHNMFNSCFLSQKSASFPSYELDGTFSELAQKIWVEQHNTLVKLMGSEYFYDSPNPMLRRSYGAIYLRDMNYKEFKEEMVSVRRLLKQKEELKIS